MPAPSNALARATPMELVKKNMARMIEALPGGREMTAKRFTQAAIGIASSPGVQGCDPMSVVKVIYECARLNLIPDPILHLAYCVPFRQGQGGNKMATLIIGYRGLVELARRADPSLYLSIGTVYAGDDYQYEEGLEPVFKITRRWWEKGVEQGKAVCYYCISQQGGGKAVMVVPFSDAVKLANASKAGSRPGTPWHDHFDRMGEKTALRRASRLWSLDPEKEDTRRFREALEHDERTDEQGDVADDGGDIFGDLAPDIEPGEARIGGVAPDGSTQPRRKVENVADAPPPEPPDEAMATANEKSAIEKVCAMKMSAAGVGHDPGNWWRIMQAATGIDDFAAAFANCNMGQIRAWRGALKAMTSARIKAACEPDNPPAQPPAPTSPPASPPAGMPSPPASGFDTPFDAVVDEWAKHRGIDTAVAVSAARSLIKLRLGIEASKLDSANADAIVAKIRTNGIRWELYETKE